MKRFKGRVIVPGSTSGEALVFHTDFNTRASFRKALMFKDKLARCAGRGNRALFGKPLAGKALCLPRIIGSATDSLVLFDAASLKLQPACLLFAKPIDSTAAAGAILAGVWTDASMPTVDCLGDAFLDAVKTGDRITVSEDGTVTVG